MRMLEYIGGMLAVTDDRRWELYKVLAEPVRLRLLALAAEEELTIGELAELLKESQPNVSRHVKPLKSTSLLAVRKQGTRVLARLADDVSRDPVVADAVAAGRKLCVADGSLARVADVVAARDQASREFFEGVRPTEQRTTAPAEFGAYLSAMGALLDRRALAVDVGTGDGRLLDVLAPVFEHVIGLDRSAAQIELARTRLSRGGYDNVSLVAGEYEHEAVRNAIEERGGADVLFVSRVLHHAPRPGLMLKSLATLCRPGGAVVVLDYCPHGDESLRTKQADLWLGFEPDELQAFATTAGLKNPHISPIPASRCGNGPDGHLDWQVMVARRPN